MKENKLSLPQLKEFLDEKAFQFNNRSFIETDPIQIPHQFRKKKDIEIAAFFASTLAWGQRKTIINNANKLMQWMDLEPHNFILNASEKDKKKFAGFVHRTFNEIDCIYFIDALQYIYKSYGSLEEAFTKNIPVKERNSYACINIFRERFFEIKHPARTAKHVSNPASGSSAKRLCMFMRWMVRKDKAGVDFGIWTKVKPSELFIPLDVHTGNVGRKLGLLNRKQNDWNAVTELSQMLKLMDPIDPIRYDFALFGLGVFDKF